MAPSNTLPVHGNEKTMNLNNMVLTNIQSSPYFKVNLFELKTYHEVVDEIYYKVSHLEPWEKGSRKTAGQTGMCGGVRGVGAGGIVSSAFCLLYKLYTLKLTRKQLNGLLTHTDSCYIRGLGFMYIRYTQPPADLWDWYEPYLADDEEIDVKAGGGHSMTIGEMVRQFMTKLEWYSTLFPRIPVPAQKSIEAHLTAYEQEERQQRLAEKGSAPGGTGQAGGATAVEGFGEAERHTHHKAVDSPVRFTGSSRRPTPPFDIAKEFEKVRRRSRSHSRSRSKRSRSRDKKRRSRSREKKRSRSRERKRSRSRERHRRRSHSRERRHRSSRSPGRRSSHKHSHRSRSRDRTSGKSSSHSRDKNSKHRESSFERDLRRERDRVDKQRRDRHRNGDH